MQSGILDRAIGILGSRQGLSESERLPVPMSTFQRPGGSLLAFDEYGSATGYPLFYFHDAGSSRLECAFYHRAARKHGYRLIAIDRPGIGGSTYFPLLDATTFCNELLRLADALQLTKFGVLALGAGGIYAMTLAHMAPDRVSNILSLGGIPGTAFNESHPSSFIASCVQGLTPACVQFMTRVRHGLFREDPEQVAAQLEELLSGADRKTLAIPRIRQLLTLDLQETLRQGGRGAAQDLGVCFRKFDFQLGAICVPTVIWQGAADRISSRSDCEFLVARMPNASYHRVTNRGHFFFVHCMDEVFGRLHLNTVPRTCLAA